MPVPTKLFGHQTVRELFYIEFERLTRAPELKSANSQFLLSSFQFLFRYIGDSDETVTLPSVIENLNRISTDRKVIVEQVLGRKCGASSKLKRPRVDSLICKK